MDAEESLARAGELIGDRRRLQMLMVLVDGQAWPAGDLARSAGIQPATASYHLERLIAGGLLAVVPQGRHRYYRLASPAVAELLEKLAALAPPAAAHSLRESHRRDALRHGRTCYDHLAGRLGVAWTQAWVDRGFAHCASGEYTLTDAGARWLERFGIAARPGASIPHHAVDWTERVPHFAGPLAKAMTRRLFDAGWMERGPIPRSVRLTPFGEQQFRDFGAVLHDTRGGGR